MFNLDNSREYRLKVMSYNIRCGIDMEGNLNMKAIADVIRNEDPDIVGLQEIDRHYSGRSNYEDQPALLAREAGYDYFAFAPNLDLEPHAEGEPRRQYGTAVLSKHPITRIHHVPLSSLGKEQRGLLEVHIGMDGADIAVYNVHFGLTADQLAVQTGEAVAQLDRTADARIVTGDFNATPDKPDVKRWAGAGMRDAFDGMDEAETFPSDKPTRRIDYIWADGGLRRESASVIDSRCSDHRPIVAAYVFTMPGG